VKTNPREQRISTSITNCNTTFLSTSEKKLESSNYQLKQENSVSVKLNLLPAFVFGVKPNKPIFSNLGKSNHNRCETVISSFSDNLVWNQIISLTGICKSQIRALFFIKASSLKYPIHLWDNTRLQEELQLLNHRTTPGRYTFP